MYNTYFSSALFTLRGKGPLSFSFNDYPNLSYERVQSNPSSSQCCSCCNCCSSSFPSNRVLVNPNLLYGLRQSTLIQWSPCRRLIFAARDPYCYRVPDCGLDHGCYDVCCEKSGRERNERRRRDRIGRLGFHQRRCLSSADDAEDVISFLSEEVSEEYLGHRDGNRSYRKRVEIERRTNCIGDSKSGRKKNGRLSQFESAKLKKECDRRKEDLEERRRREEEKAFRRREEWKEYRCQDYRDEEKESRTVSSRENYRRRKPSSSSSSYHSLPSMEDFGSHKEAEDENVGLLEASSSGYYRDSWNGEDNFEEEVEDFERQEVVGQKTSNKRNDAEWELRKKTEKKLTEIEETQSQRDSSRSKTRTARASGSDYMKASSSAKQFGNELEKSNVSAGFAEVGKKQYIRKRDEEVIDMNTKRSSQYQTQFIGREEDNRVDVNLVEEKRGRYHETVDASTGMVHTRNNQQISQISETGNVVKSDTRSQSLSESRMKIREEDIALRSNWEAREKRQQAFKQMTDQIESQKVSKRLFETSRVNDKDSMKMLQLQSQIEMKNQEGGASFVSQSSEKTKEKRSHGDQKIPQRFHSGNSSQDVTNIAVNVTNVSITQSTDVNRVNYSQVASGKMTDQRTEPLSSVNPIQEARERDNRLDNRIASVKSRDDTHKAAEVSYFQEENSGETSQSHEYWETVSQEPSQLINVGELGYRRSKSAMIPPSRQMVDRSSRIDPVSVTPTLEVPAETSQRSPSAVYAYSETPGDTMVSAQHLEETSNKFVGEYLDMAWEEALASEIPDANMAYESGDENNSSQSASKVSQQSGVTGAKGPSDEMWDVTGPPPLEPPKSEAPEDNTSTMSTVVKRSGRSLWGIISDVVRLRWGSRVETPKPTKRSGGKSSSNDSVSSEAWFSGHDPEETSDKNGERGKSSPEEATSSHHQQPIQASVQSQGEVSSTLSSKSTIRPLEPSAPSPSTAYTSGSTSKGVSSPAEAEDLEQGKYRKDFEIAKSLDGKSPHVSFPSKDAGESSVLPPSSSSMSTVTAGKFYGKAGTNVVVGGAMEIKEQPFMEKPIEVPGSEGKEGELKQRKLQRNKQVVKDKFDEWEEAYARESEQRRIDEIFMREALVEAKKAADTWEVPVGAVLVQHGQIIARGYNLVEELRDSTAHAEMMCIREASNQLRSWRLAECTLYVTLEPCAMCAGAILQARIDTLVWGAPNKLLGADGSWIRLFPNTEGGDKPAAPPHPFHPKMTIRRGILEAECADAMQQFFQLRRKKKAKSEESVTRSALPIASHQSKFLRKMHDVFHAFLCL